jgi:hypothetical protein
MYNKKVLIDALKKLDSVKAPAVKKDIIVNPFNQMGMPTMKRGGLLKFLDGGGNPTCPKDYKWNSETKRCEKTSGCPDDFTFDPKSGRCISNYQKEGKTTVKVKPRGTNDFTTATPDQLTSKYKNDWPEDLNIEQIQNPVYFPEAQTQLTVTHPNYKNTYNDDLKDLATIRRYPDLNYKVVIDPSKPEGFNKTENIYYVNSENTHQARKYKEWEKLKNLEKQNIQKLTDAGFNIQESDSIPVMLPKVSSDYYTSAEPIVDADGNTYIPSDIYKEGWDPKKVRAEEKRAQEFYNDPEYLGYVPKDVSYEDFYKGRPGTVKENYKYLCKDCSYGHGQRYKVGNDYLYENTNLYNNLLPPKEFDWESETPLEYEYADPSIESMYPKLEFEQGVDRPSYSPTDTYMDVPTFGVKLPINPIKRLFDKGIPRTRGNIDIGEREVTRFIPKMVQKATGYDRKFMEGYEDDEGNYIPGEIEKAEQEGRQINFKGASSLRDKKQQKKYNKKWANSEEENKLIRKQNEDLLNEYGMNREEYVKLYGDFKYGGGLNKFTEGGDTQDYEVLGRSEHNAPAIGDYPEKEVNVKKSNIHGKGLFAEEPIRAGEIIGLSHVKSSYSKNGNEYITSNATPILGAYHNHSEDTNTESIVEGNKRYLKAIKDIQVGEEITSDYTSIDDPTLEKPKDFGNDFKNGGSSRSRLPNRRNEKAYSRSLEATNKLFAVHPFFAKAKSRKNKIYDPNAKYYEDGGSLPKAEGGYAIGLGDKSSITATPFDFRSNYGQIGNYNRNPNYSLTYTNPKLFKKMDAASNALSFTLGRPYNTSAADLTNPTLDLSTNTSWDYNDAGNQNNPAYQNFWQNATAGGNNAATFNSYQAAQNLANLKPLYKKGLPFTADIGYDLVGNAFGSSSNGPFTGAFSTHAGYAPESGLYGNIDASMLGVFGRRKHGQKITPNRYYSQGLTRQGDMAFIPKLNIFNAQIKQRADYNKVQEDELVRLMGEDAINGTQTARPYQYKMDKGDPFDLSFLSPELTFQAKPFKNIPGIFSATAGARLNYEGGKQREGVPLTPNFYGNVRYSIPLGETKRKVSARMPERNNYDNEEIETETETETETNEKPTINNDIQLNFDGQGVGKADCPDGYERPCEKCKCEKINIPTSYTDKRGKHLFGNKPLIFKQGGEQNYINANLSQKEIDKYIKDGYIVEEVSKALPRADGGLEVVAKKGIPFLSKLTKLGKVTAPVNATLLNAARATSTILPPALEVEQNILNNQTRPLSHSDQMIEMLNNQIRETPTYTELLQLNPQNNQYQIPYQDLYTSPEYSDYTELESNFADSPIDEINLKNIPTNFDPKNVSFPFQVKGDSGFWQVAKNNYSNNDNDWHFTSSMYNPFESGRAMKIMNEVFPKPNPSILETSSLSLDSLNALLNMGKRKDWDINHENYLPLNTMSIHSKLFDDIIPGINSRDFILSARTAPKSDIDKAVNLLNEDIFKKGFSEKAYWDPLGSFKIPNYRLTRKYNEGGETDYELGDEVDEETKKYLESLGYTFETI